MKKLHIYLLGRLLITVTLACTMAVSTFGGLLQVGASTISIESQKKDNNQAVTLLENNVYNDIDGAWIYKGNWWKATVSSALGGQLHDSSGVGDNAAISITGSGFTLIFSRGPDYGKLDVVIDGQNIHRIDQTRTTNYYQKEWTSPELAMGTHIIKFVHAKGKLVNIDAIKVYGTTPNPSSTPTGSPVITQTPTVAIITSPTNSGPVQDATSTLPPNPTVSPTPSLIPSPIANATSTLAPTQVSGTQIYYVSTSGSDFNPGTQTQPWKTIQKAVDTVPPGSTVIVKAGTYDQRVAIKRSILSLVADGKVTTKAIDVTGDNNIVRGFTFTDPSANAGIMVKGNNNLFEKNEIYHTAQDGIWFFGHDNTFRGNYIHDILDPSIGGDPHVDCFQSWGWNWDTYNVLFEKNVCNHTRTSGSNQIVMLARNTTAQVRDIT
ncbi:MAG TPA: DUF1565 domain-containing protein, partial [Anaerolineales bacterium]|nr:DUF1565 domain-containing protein [Anaerolineales bacterium]